MIAKLNNTKAFVQIQISKSMMIIKLFLFDIKIINNFFFFSSGSQSISIDESSQSLYSMPTALDYTDNDD